MKALEISLAMLAAMTLVGTSHASEADSSATAGSGGGRNGSATATAGYTGDAGFARTDTRSGNVNLARGVAVGVDDDGLSLSISNAVATRFGPAVATNFNLSIGADGRVSNSTGVSVANGPFERSASAGGSTSTARFGGGSSSFAEGRTDRLGHVRAVTRADDSRPVRGLSGGRPVVARERPLLSRGPDLARRPILLGSRALRDSRDESRGITIRRR